MGVINSKECLHRIKENFQRDLMLQGVPDVLPAYKGGLSVFGKAFLLAPSKERTVLRLKAHFFERVSSQDTFLVSHAKTRGPVFSVKGKSAASAYGGMKLQDRKIVKDMSGAVRPCGVELQMCN